MTENLNKTDLAGKSHDVEGDTPEKCPACGTSQLEEDIPIPHRVCSECGFVTGTETTVPSSVEEDDGDESVGARSWSEYYSVRNSTEKQVATALERLEQLGDALLLDDETRLQVADVYAGAAEENVTDGRPTRRIVAASICIGTREAGVARPSDRVAKAAGLKPGQIKKTIRTILGELNRGYTAVSPADYVPYLCDDTELSAEIESRAISLVKQFKEQNQTGNHPAGIAGAAIWAAADGAVTQRQIATSAGVTKETIRVRLSDLREEISV